MFNPQAKLSTALETERLARAIPLLAETMKNNVANVRKLIASGVDVNLHAPGGGKTALHMAVDNNCVPMVEMLIARRADVNAVTARGFTPLHVAAQQDHAGLIRILIRAGSDINARCDVGCTPLHEAAANGHLHAVAQLLRLKADPTIKDSRYFLTPAKLALINHFDDIADMLMISMTYQQKFTQDIHYILTISKQALPAQSQEHQFLHELAQSLGVITNADNFYLAVSAALQSPAYQSLKDKLRQCRHLIIAAMKQYNSDKLEAAKETSSQTPTATHSDATSDANTPAATASTSQDTALATTNDGQLNSIDDGISQLKL